MQKCKKLHKRFPLLPGKLSENSMVQVEEKKTKSKAERTMFLEIQCKKRKTLLLKGLAESVGLLSVERWHSSRADAGLKASGGGDGRNATSGALLQSRGSRD